MSPGSEDDWSDSDEELDPKKQTLVQLGVPDGPIEDSSDLRDAAVSRIGGPPAFLSSPIPSFSDAVCKNCSRPMELLTQVWCPLEESPYDRALYVWGCARGICQRLEGSVRAFRGLRYNEKYAIKLQNQLRRKEEQAQEQASVTEDKKVPKLNPFSIQPGKNPGLYSLGSQVFGDSPDSVDEEHASKTSEEDNEGSDEESLVTALAEVTLEGSDWITAPSYSAQYLSTMAEYIPPLQKPKIPAGAQVLEQEDQKKGDDGGWYVENYENSLDVDQVFERFTKRVAYEGEQCVRYELGGMPLPFAHDEVFDRLFPRSPAPNLPVTKPGSMVVPAQKRLYDLSSLPSCPHCKGERVFECQLMPNLINILRGSRQGPEKKLTDEERREEVKKALQKGGSGVELGDMEWGTCMIFSCKNDCCRDRDKELKSCWREEVVLIQWDN